jgi:hypothetical protein
MGPNRRNRLVDLNLAIGFGPTIGGFEGGSKTRIGNSAYKRGEGRPLVKTIGSHPINTASIPRVGMFLIFVLILILLCSIHFYISSVCFSDP